MKDLIYNARFISSPYDPEKRCLAFSKKFKAEDKVVRATLLSSAIGVYKAEINGRRVSDDVLAPGWTSYRYRLQYQSYDVTSLIEDSNELCITVGIGWRKREVADQITPYLKTGDYALIASLLLEYENGKTDYIITDESWDVSETRMRYSDMFGGDICDMTFVPPAPQKARGFMHPHGILIPQECEPVREHERLPAKSVIKTPAGETVIDFGQNMTGYVEFHVCGKYGERCVFDHAEVLDRDGNFYNANYRTAKNEIVFVCDGKPHTYKPEFSFQGFRYIRIKEWAGELALSDFTAIVVHTDIKRTGYFECSDKDINQLYHNIIWGQKSNFLDVPTDCPQRDERMGWTGDAQVFCRCASLNYKVDRFFFKWLDDMAADQRPTGSIPSIIPNFGWCTPSAAWADAAVIIPWQLYLSYGNIEFLRRYYPMMRLWVNYTYETPEYIKAEKHFGDWLSTDVKGDFCEGSTSKEYIARAFRIYSTSLLLKAGEVLGISPSGFDEKLASERRDFAERYFDKTGRLTENTQTAHVLALYFGITPDRKKTAAALAALLHENGDRLTTGFVGTPYLLHVLTDCGYSELAMTLLFQHKCPSWLYSVDHGATTMWEHWDGIKEDGSFWNESMNSFNHYAYGAVGDWLYSVLAGINYDEKLPGFEKIVFSPVTTDRLSRVSASIDTKYGRIISGWERKDGKTEYVFTVPHGTKAEARIDGSVYELHCGENTFSSEK